MAGLSFVTSFHSFEPPRQMNLNGLQYCAVRLEHIPSLQVSNECINLVVVPVFPHGGLCQVAFLLTRLITF